MGKALGKHPNFDVCLCDDKLAMKQNHPQMPHLNHTALGNPVTEIRAFVIPASCALASLVQPGMEQQPLKAWTRGGRKVPVWLLESALTWSSFTGQSPGAVAHG